METEILCCPPQEAADFIERDCNRILASLNGLKSPRKEHKVIVCMNLHIEFKHFKDTYRDMIQRLFDERNKLEVLHDVKLLCTDVHSKYWNDKDCCITAGRLELIATFSELKAP